MCGEIIRAEAMKCRFCGHVLDAALESHDPPSYILSDIENDAGKALLFGIIGLFICGPVFGSMAISRGNRALRELDNYPLFPGGPRGKANAGRILGWIDWALLALVFLIRIANAGR
jgi:hypothetical protein